MENKIKEDYYFDKKKVRGISDRDRLDLRNLKYYPLWGWWNQLKFHISLHNRRKCQKKKGAIYKREIFKGKVPNGKIWIPKGIDKKGRIVIEERNTNKFFKKLSEEDRTELVK